MKTEIRRATHVVSESRKIRKPLMEKKRRARINDSLETLKQILLESKTTLKESKDKNGQRSAKLEKADILEMTVKYLQSLHSKLCSLQELPEYEIPTVIQKKEIKIRPADSSSCDGVTLYPKKLPSGEVIFVFPSGFSHQSIQQHCKNSLNKNSEEMSVWRPW